MDIEIKVTDPSLYEETGVPAFATGGSCAVDLRSAVDCVLNPGESALVDCGIAIHAGSVRTGQWEGFALSALILPRSGLGTKRGIVLSNSVGLIDEDYTGNIFIGVWNRNLGKYAEQVSFRRGERIAQMMFVPVVIPKFIVVDEFSKTTERGSGGAGSTGRF